jgi:hypothetical protein
MENAKSTPFNRSQYKTQTSIPVAKGNETTYPFQWLLFKPQLHAIEPFVTQQATRNENTTRPSISFT